MENKNLYKNLERQYNKIFRHIKVGSFKTRERYGKAFKRFMVFLVENYHLQKLANISPKHIFAYIDNMQNKGLSASTIKTELAAIRFFQDSMPYTRYELPTNGELELERRTFGGVDRTWSKQEFNNMVAIAMQNDREDYATIQNYFNEKYSSGKRREEGGLSPSFLKKHYSVLKRALDYAVKIKLIPINPILNVELPKQQRYNAKYYSVEQLEKLLEITKGTIIESVVFIAVHYGLRRGEILGMRYEDVDFKEKTITIRNTRTKVRTDVEKRPKSDASMRTLPLIPRVEEYLMKLKESQAMDKLLFGKEYNDNDYICKYADGTPVNIGTLSHKFRKILEKNQMPHIRFHDIRHSVASYLLKNGISLKEIQLWCGHSDIAVTAMFYTHVDIEMKRNTGNKINELFAS